MQPLFEAFVKLLKGDFIYLLFVLSSYNVVCASTNLWHEAALLYSSNKALGVHF